MKINYLNIKNLGTTYCARLINEDVSNSFQLFDSNFIINFFSIITYIPILITIFIWDKFIFILFVLSIFLFLFYSIIENKITRNLYAKVFEKLGNILHFINETLDKVLTIQIFNYFDKRIKQYKNKTEGFSKDYKSLGIRQQNLRSFFLDFPQLIIKK